MDTVAAIGSIGSCIGSFLAVGVALYVFFASKRPHVVAYLDSQMDHGALYFVVKNVGSSVAYDIKISCFDYEIVMQEVVPAVQASFVEKGIPMLVPDASRRTFIAKTNWAKEHIAEKEPSIKVSYARKGALGHKKAAVEEFILDYYSFANSLYERSDISKAANAAETTAEILTAMNEITKKIALALAPVPKSPEDSKSEESFRTEGRIREIALEGVRERQSER